MEAGDGRSNGLELWAQRAIAGGDDARSSQD
jgi:hypothetical protein